MLLPSSLVFLPRAAPVVGSTAPIERAPPSLSDSINLGARSGSEEPTTGAAPLLFDSLQTFCYAPRGFSACCDKPGFAP